mgnify:FL=1
MSNFNLPEAVSIAASGNEALKASREDYVVWCATWWHAFFSQTGVPGRVDGCAALAKAIGRAGDPTDARWDCETLTRLVEAMGQWEGDLIDDNQLRLHARAARISIVGD